MHILTQTADFILPDVRTIILIDIYIWEQMDFIVVLDCFPSWALRFLTFEMQERLLSNVNNHSRRVISAIIWGKYLIFFFSSFHRDELFSLSLQLFPLGLFLS